NTRFGLPEVNVGLIPGAGGTQRGPRLMGWDMAVEMACFGKTFTAPQLLEIKAIDAISEDPAATIPSFLQASPAPISQKKITPPSAEQIEGYRKKIIKFAKGRTAPDLNLDALLWASDPYEVGQPKERALHLQLRQSSQSRALRHVFFAERAATRPAQLKSLTPAPLSHIAIVGGGLMGSGIATACLNGGYHVTVIERSVQAADDARRTITSLMQAALKRGKITAAQLESRLAASTTTSDYADAASADLAIEAVFEDLGAKRTVFNALANVMRPDAILATNTSYLDPNAIFANIAGRDRCVGIHFFSPAHIMKLVEVIKADGTSDATLATAFSLTAKLRKTPVLAGVCDGFIGNRILSAYRRAAEYLLADGALPHEIDAAMRAFGMAMGPFEAQDLSGLQIAQANRRRQDATRDPSERYVTIADELCAAERYGKRSGAGWYQYGQDNRPQVDPAVEKIITAYAENNGITRHSFSVEDIQSQLLSAMANEGAKIVAEGIADSDATIDVVKTSGYGFPRWRGGPMHWANEIGDETLRSALNSLETASPGSWTRAARYAPQ
ncbi:MAG: 3-hydroxyacyl-CoA dehydrogenase NAD-binding domain-containing protein, partial [Sulfitobacter sp.]